MKRAPTPETDPLYNPENGWTGVVPISYARKLERERDAIIAERDEARSWFNEIDLCKNGQAPCKWSLKLIAERDLRQQEAKRWRDMYLEYDEMLNRLLGNYEVTVNERDTAIAERDEARKQRDRLAEALRDIANGISCQECGGEDQARFAREALQSLTNQLK